MPSDMPNSMSALTQPWSLAGPTGRALRGPWDCARVVAIAIVARLPFTLHDFFRNAQAGATGEELLRLVWAIVCYRGFSSPIVAAGNTVD